MLFPPSHRTCVITLWIGCLIGLSVRLWVAWQPVEELVWRVTADDAYYYFKLAQNLGSGLGATLDGVNYTNGFHPLYALLLVPIFQFSGNNLDFGVHSALTLVALFSTLTAWPIYQIGRSLHSPQAGVIGGLLYVLNPWVVVLTMTGVESAVYLFFFAWTVAAYMLWRNGTRSPSGIVWTAVFAGLTIMSRSEGILLLLGVGLDILLLDRNSWRTSISTLGIRRTSISTLGILGIVAGVVCLPWIVWSSLSFGSPLQISSTAIMLHTHVGAPQGFWEYISWYLQRTSWFIPRYAYKIVLFNLPVVLIIAGLLIGYRRSLQWRAGLRVARSLMFLLVPFFLASIYYNLILWHQQHWYFNSLVLIVTLISTPMIAAWLVDVRSDLLRRIYQVGFVGMVSVFVAVVGLMWQRGLYPGGQEYAYHTGHWIAESSIQDKRFAATDSGIVGFFCECKLVNLDGVMNNPATEYYRIHGYSQDSIAQFMRLQHGDYVIAAQTEDTLLHWGDVVLQQYVAIDQTNFALYRLDQP